MANTYTTLFYHIVFSTKNRGRFIRPEIENKVWAYVGDVARHHKFTAIQVGGVEDHLHALVMAPPTIAPFEIAKYLKGESSKWIRETFSELCRFAWQDGYAGFTVSKSNVSEVVKYIQGQRTHHKTHSYQEEISSFLKKHEIAYDERYLKG
jgi:putative transposase